MWWLFVLCKVIDALVAPAMAINYLFVTINMGLITLHIKVHSIVIRLEIKRDFLKKIYTQQNILQALSGLDQFFKKY